MNRGKLYLIPSLLCETETPYQFFSQHIKEVINSTDEYIVEDLKHARRFLKQMGIEKPLLQIAMHEMGKHADKTAYFGYFKSIEQGKNIGVISEAGCPGVADPGAEIVSLAHSKNIEVVPLVGPSSLLLALMASGFNGQNFAFVGYLPIDKTERIKRIKYLEQTADKNSQTQLFIETPFRNNQVLKDILDNCKSDTYLSIAADITMPTQFIKTKSIKDWKKEIPELHKRPCVFSIYVK